MLSGDSVRTELSQAGSVGHKTSDVRSVVSVAIVREQRTKTGGGLRSLPRQLVMEINKKPAWGKIQISSGHGTLRCQ